MGISSALGSSALLPAGLGFRNLIINGDFRINQRGFTSTTSDQTYGFDRWLIATSGGATWTPQTFTPGNAISGYEPTNFSRIVTTGQSGSGVYTLLVQRVEDVRSLAGQRATVSFYVKVASSTANIAIESYQNFGSGGSSDVATYLGTVSANTGWQRVTLTFSMPSVSGKTIGSGSYVAIQLWVSAGSSFSARTGSLGIQSNTFDVWGVQLEGNYQPTPFEQRPIGIELSLCQRYYEKSYRYGTAPGTGTFDALITMAYSSAAGTSGELGGHVMMNTYKRIPPNITWYDHAGNINKCTRLQAGVANHANQSVVNGATGEHYLGVASVSGAGSTCAIQLHFVAECEL